MFKKQVNNRRLSTKDGKRGIFLRFGLGRFGIGNFVVGNFVVGKSIAILSGLFGIALLVFLSLYFGIHSVGHVVQRPIAEISVESDFNYVNRQDIMTMLHDTIHKSFLYENLGAVKGELEKNAWIDRVVLSRKWPDRLHLKIIEQVPIARWSDFGFINYRGELVAVSDVRPLVHLPHLAGPVEDSVEVLEQYQAISKLLRKYDLEVAGLIKNQRHRWMVKLTNGWQINLGRGQLMEKMQRFSRVLKGRLLAYRYSIAIVDMRYQHGVAVQWLKDKKIEGI